MVYLHGLELMSPYVKAWWFTYVHLYGRPMFCQCEHMHAPRQWQVPFFVFWYIYGQLCPNTLHILSCNYLIPDFLLMAVAWLQLNYEWSCWRKTAVRRAVTRCIWEHMYEIQHKSAVAYSIGSNYGHIVYYRWCTWIYSSCSSASTVRRPRICHHGNYSQYDVEPWSSQSEVLVTKSGNCILILVIIWHSMEHTAFMYTQ